MGASLKRPLTGNLNRPFNPPRAPHCPPLLQIIFGGRCPALAHPLASSPSPAIISRLFPAGARAPRAPSLLPPPRIISRSSLAGARAPRAPASSPPPPPSDYSKIISCRRSRSSRSRLLPSSPALGLSQDNFSPALALLALSALPPSRRLGLSPDQFTPALPLLRSPADPDPAQLSFPAGAPAPRAPSLGFPSLTLGLSQRDILPCCPPPPPRHWPASSQHHFLRALPT